MPDVLRQRNTRLLLAGQGISLLGDRLINVALAFAVIELGGSATEIGLVFAARMAPLVACLLFGGVIADRVPRRTLMVVADAVRVGTQGTMAVLLIAGSAEIWHLAVLSGLTGAATGFYSPAATGLLPALVAPEDIQQVNGARSVIWGLGEIGGPVLAGALVATVGSGWAIAFDAATFAASAILLALLSIPRTATRAAVQSFVADLKEGWAAFRSRSWVWSFVAAAAVGNMLFASWNILGPIVAEDELGGAAVWGTIVGALGVGSLVGGISVLRMQPRRPMVVASVSVAAFSLPLGLLALGAPVWALILSTFASGVGLMISNTIWESTLQRHVPGEVLSRVSAYDWFGSMAFQPIGAAIWGPIAALIGVSAALGIACVVQVVSTLAVLAVPEVRRLPAFPDVSERALPSTAR